MFQQVPFSWVRKFLHSIQSQGNWKGRKESAETIGYKHLTKGLCSLFSIALPTETLPFLPLFKINFLHVLLLHCDIPWFPLQNSFVRSDRSKKANFHQPHIRLTDAFMVVYEQPTSMLQGCTASFSTPINSKSCLCLLVLRNSTSMM